MSSFTLDKCTQCPKDTSVDHRRREPAQRRCRILPGCPGWRDEATSKERLGCRLTKRGPGSATWLLSDLGRVFCRKRGLAGPHTPTSA